VDRSLKLVELRVRCVEHVVVGIDAPDDLRDTVIATSRKPTSAVLGPRASFKYRSGIPPKGPAPTR
jgi:hypothetical protein